MLAIETRALTKQYGRARGIIELDLAVEPGECFGFIGPNGAGKSTTIRTLLGFIFPTRGQASIFGRDVVRDTALIKRQVGYIPAEAHYYDEMTVRDLLAYAASFYHQDCRSRIADLIERFEIDPDKRIDALSSGNRRKVAIVQAVLHRPRLLILDEPTGGLDPLMQKRFFDLLREENQAGVTLFFSSHILGEVERLCQRVAIIKEGRLLRLETIESLRASRPKKIRFHLPDDIARPDLEQRVPGLSRLQQENGTVQGLYQGQIQPLLAQLTALGIDDLWLEELSLEELFMHVYAGGA
jgi:ABC-2 type transport system ATP-binding protein